MLSAKGCWKIVDTPVFQRLRNIKQLAQASLIYPGALHTRFEHSPGVFHVAGSIRIFTVALDEFSTEAKTVLGSYKENPETLEFRMDIERRVADALSSSPEIGEVAPELVIFKCVKVKPVLELALKE
jgi:hypothetical protein